MYVSLLEIFYLINFKKVSFGDVKKLSSASFHLHIFTMAETPFRHCIFAISYLSPLVKGRGSSFEQTWIPFTHVCFAPNLVEIGSVVLELKFFNFVTVFPLFRNYLPLEKGGALHLNKPDSPSQRMKCAKFGWNWPSGSGEDENVKSLWQHRRRQPQWWRQTMDKLWSVKLTWAFH